MMGIIVLTLIPGVCRIKWRMKPALKAKKRKVFGKVVIVKARPARKVVKAFLVSVLEKVKLEEEGSS